AAAATPPPAGGASPPAPRLEPGDALYPQQWSLPQIGMPAVWDGGTSTPGLLVGVVDTGIALDHPDLVPNIAHNAIEAAGVAGVDDDGNGFVDDVDGWDFMAETPDPYDGHGHGTHVAGIIGAASDGVFGTVGVSWEIDLLAVKMFTDQAVGTNLSGARGIAYAVDRGARIVCMSWGTGSYSRVIEDAIAYGEAQGVVLVASAGNDSESVLESYPAALDAVITVAATGQNDRYAGFSNRGPRIDLVAPGDDILSTWRDRHLMLSGTSQAAPHVAGVAAHILHRHPTFTPEEVRAALTATAFDLGIEGWEPTFGAGRLDAARAVAVDHPPLAVIHRPHTLERRGSGTLEIVGTVRGAGGGRLEWGRGETPPSWQLLWEGGEIAAQPLASLVVDALEPGPVTLRLVADGASGLHVEDRVVVVIDREAPALVGVDDIQQLGGGRLRQLVRLTASERVALRAFLRPRGSAEPFTELVRVDKNRRHTLDLSGLLPGTYEYGLQLEDLGGLRTTVPGDGPLLERQLLPAIDIDGTLFEEAARIDGFELGVVADLDGDGLPELLGERRAQPTGSGPVEVWSPDLASHGFRQRFSGLRGLPIDARDLDADGVMEVLLADSVNSSGPGGSTWFSVYSGLLGGEPRLLERWPDGNRLFGGRLADTDGDGQGEILYASSDDALLKLREYRGGTFEPRDLQFASPVPRTAGVAIDDFDGDGLTEIAMGTLSGEALVLEYTRPGATELREVFRQPLLGGVSNAIVATRVEDADQDGRPEFAISTVGVIADRDQRPAVVLYEAAGDDAYVESAWFEVRDKNNPFDNGLATTDLNGDGHSELLVAMAGDVYLIDALGDDRYEPIWHRSRQGGGRVFSADVDGDGRREVMIVERTASGPRTTIVAQRSAPQTVVLPWSARREAAGVVLRWSPVGGARLLDLAIYRLPAGEEQPAIETDLFERRVHVVEGELGAPGQFEDRPSGDAVYRVGYTVADGERLLRVLSDPRIPAAAPPRVTVGAPAPSPFVERTTLTLALDRPATVAVAVYDVQGRLARRLTSRRLDTGVHPIVWDGRDAVGRPVPAGLYLLDVSSDLGHVRRKVVRLR
ncbi:MAG: S8 family serine peptidase, partial [Candidatus Eiseniibacteriota bacterium]